MGATSPRGFSELVEALLQNEPFSRAFAIVQRTLEKQEADICTLFVVQDGEYLTLADGFARLDKETIFLPKGELRYPLRGKGKRMGLTATVAVTGEAVHIPSHNELRAQPSHLGKWDHHLYPDGVDDPVSGFGCLYAVPLLQSSTGDPRKDVAGVFKIERRRARPAFTDVDRALFDLLASHLSLILQRYRPMKQAVLDVGAEFAKTQRAITECVAALESSEPTGGKAERLLRGTLESMEQMSAHLEETCREASPWLIDAFFPLLGMQLESVPGADVGSPSGPSAARGAEEIAGALRSVSNGFKTLPLPTDFKKKALAHLEQWLTEKTFKPYRDQLYWLIEQEQWPLLLDSFYRVIPFGTGGRRGPVGIGTNRFNPYTLASSVQGHIDFLRGAGNEEQLSVVLAYDVREFRDLRGVYKPDLPNPLLGMTSRYFARLAAEVYAANGVLVYMLPEGSTRYISTPELSFSIRYLGATAGLNISASHNHPDDNGGKFYNRSGGQEVPPYDQHMARRVEEVAYLARLDFESARSIGLISPLPEEAYEAYIETNLHQSLSPGARQAKIVFTPLHGTGDTSVGEVLRRSGFAVELVAEQSTYDGAFPAVPYRAPNPEVPESMEMGMELARRTGADVVFACDPDADRIGVCAKRGDGDYQFFNGNEVSILVTHMKLEQLKAQGKLPSRPIVMKTEVTTELLRSITEAHGGRLIGDLLVGFKYHGNILEVIDRTGLYMNEKWRLEDFVIGVEESHGVLVTSDVRDKDAAGAAILLAELASLQRQKNLTVSDYLNDIYRRFGYHANHVVSMVMTGAEGLANIQRIQESLRRRPPTKIGRWRVEETTDHWDEKGIHGPIKSETDRASRNVLGFRLENGSRIILRPSGTEPKNKIYIEVPAPPLGADADDAALQRQKEHTDAKLREISDDFSRQMLATIDVELPGYALRISGLVPLDKRIEFVEEFIPGLESRALRGAAKSRNGGVVTQWIDERLSSFGADARRLVSEAMSEYLKSEQAALDRLPKAEAEERRATLATIEAAFFPS